MSDPDDELLMRAASPLPYVTITQGLRGHFAVLMYWNDEPGAGFWEPWQSGIGSYRDAEGAAKEAQEWADAEGLEYLR